MSYQHLTLEERYCLAEFREKGLSIRVIARMLKRSPSTISRELRRNRGKRGYHPYGAYSKAKHRRRMPRRLLKGFEAEKLEYVMRALSEWHWSPEQIAGRWRKEHPDSEVVRRSTGTSSEGYCPGSAPENTCAAEGGEE